MESHQFTQCETWILFLCHILGITDCKLFGIMERDISAADMDQKMVLKKQGLIDQHGQTSSKSCQMILKTKR